MARSMVEIKTSNGTVFLRRDAVLSISANLNASGKVLPTQTIAIVHGGAAVLLHASVNDVAKALGFDRDDEPTPVQQLFTRASAMMEEFAESRRKAEAAVSEAMKARFNGFEGIGDPLPHERVAQLQNEVDNFDVKASRNAA